MAKDWTALLESVLDNPCRDRPFVCKGLPDDSQVILLGKDPATELGPDWNWWDYWDPQTGFDYDRWIEYYRNEKKKSGKPGEFSLTRCWLNDIRQRKIRAVETNVYQNDEVPNYRVLRILCKEMSGLKAIIAYGKEAKAFVEQEKLPHDLVIVSRHFAARGAQRFYRQDMDELCSKIDKKLAARPT